jgi:hypothetical protein
MLDAQAGSFNPHTVNLKCTSETRVAAHNIGV